MRVHDGLQLITDSGYQGLQKLHGRVRIPKKHSKKKPLTRKDKKYNRQIAADQVLNKNVIGTIKRFKIIADKYRNRRKKFKLRSNLIAAIYNLNLKI